MKRTGFPFALAVVLATALVLPSRALGSERWSAERARSWYAAQPWILGSDYIPSDAINELEMWQAATFDPKRIDLELGWAQGLGMNTMRVFLHNLLWEQDPNGFKQRVRIFLTIAARHHIKPIFVLFDSCWDPDPKLGPQHPPVPGVHNSGWVQAPGAQRLDDPSQYGKLEAYVKDMVGSFGKDDRVRAWDVWNEPDNPGGGNYAAREPKDKFERVAALLPRVFAWAREEHPIQPLTSGLWHGPDWSKPAGLNAVERTQLADSDVLTFHNYDWPEDFLRRIRQLETYDRPIICTEYMAREAGSTIDGDLPVAKRLNVGMINWGLVNGKTQTNFPWDSWERPYVLMQPMVWFHDLLYPDGTPYREREARILRVLSAAPKGVVPDSIELGAPAVDPGRMPVKGRANRG
ncbi:MAG: 1,4-beta-xylanase [Steroidobacteraceae bacterium]